VKILTILGTRPEIIRLSCIIPKLDDVCDHVLVHTGQNFDRSLSELFFDELGLREPDYHMGIQSGHFGEQISQIIARSAEIYTEHKPDRLLLLGDTNSALSALPAKRMGIKVYHMEAGNRCYDDRVPEEINRRIIDHTSDVLMPYTERSRQNLVAEGIASHRIYVTGNPILEVIQKHVPDNRPGTLAAADVHAGEYVLVTLHRAENVDDPTRLKFFLIALRTVHDTFGKPVIVSTHPRTRNKLKAIGHDTGRETGIRFVQPFGFPDFITLQRQAFCVLTDSGTVQEESCIFGVPNVTLRDVTERPETVECGSNILSGADPEAILRSVKIAVGRKGRWTAPVEYTAESVSDVVLNILMSYRAS